MFCVLPLKSGIIHEFPFSCKAFLPYGKKEISDQVRKSPLYIVHSHSSRPVRPQTIQTAAVIENDPQDQPLCRPSFTYDLNNTQANMAGC